MGPIRCRSASLSLSILILAPLVVGCQGCRDGAEAPAAVQPANKIEPGAIRSLPEDAAGPGVPVKPGHWMSVAQSWKATTQDYRGQLIGEPLWEDVIAAASPVSSPLRSVRPAVLPKGQTKELDSRLLIPPAPRGTERLLSIHSRFEAFGQVMVADSGQQRALVMAPDEYFFVVLTERPERFSALRLHDWATPPRTASSDIGSAPRSSLDYRIVVPAGEGRLPIPDTFFEWTSTAYVLWDDVMPEKLTADQRQSLRDWVQWGGQIIVNGPAAAQALSDSEFADLLPLQSIRSEPLDADQFVRLIRRWSVSTDASVAGLTERLQESTARGGIAGERGGAAADVPGTDGLVVERENGRGRVVISRFDLAAPWLLQWSSVQSFYNAILLRRPPREYRLSDGQVQLGFAGREGEHADDPRFSTRLRIFARDAALPAGAAPDSEPSRWLDAGVPYAPGIAVGTWTDRSDVGLMADQLLRDEAGISIPKTAFVAKALAIYLFILVPLNYLIFALVGRLEWAWVAVPVIGLIGAAWVARAARLDIGFARSRTEINLLEIQGNYPRGHLSRYLAIYNSLSTAYELRFDDRAAVAAPVGVFDDRPRDANSIFRHAFDSGVTLDGVSIPSNQTKAIHAEQMLSLGGSLRLDPQNERIENGTDLSLLDAVLVTRETDGTIRHDTIGMLEPGAATAFRLRAGPGRLPSDLPMGVDSLMLRLVAGQDLAAGEYRLVGRCETAQPGLVVQPSVLQTQQQTVVVVHLARPPLPSPEADRNLRSDFPSAGPEGVMEIFESISDD